jgi:hypothetical protein
MGLALTDQWREARYRRFQQVAHGLSCDIAPAQGGSGSLSSIEASSSSRALSLFADIRGDQAEELHHNRAHDRSWDVATVRLRRVNIGLSRVD